VKTRAFQIFEQSFRITVQRGADLLSTHPSQPWCFTPLHQAAFAGDIAITRVLVGLLRTKKLLQQNLGAEAHPRGRGEHGFPVELARGRGEGSWEIVQLLRDASHWNSRQQMATLLLCFARHNDRAVGANHPSIYTHTHTYTHTHVSCS